MLIFHLEGGYSSVVTNYETEMILRNTCSRKAERTGYEKQITCWTKTAASHQSNSVRVCFSYPLSLCPPLSHLSRDYQYQLLIPGTPIQLFHSSIHCSGTWCLVPPYISAVIHDINSTSPKTPQPAVYGVYRARVYEYHAVFHWRKNYPG